MTSNELFELRSAKPSLMMRLVEWGLKRQPKIFPQTAEATREYLANRELPNDAPLPEKFERSFDIERFELKGQECVTFHPKSGKGLNHILYFHGGGFTLPLHEVHWPYIANLVEKTGSSVTVALYDLVPEAPYTNAEALADAAFDRIAEDWEPARIIAAGDSAGGHMALNLALRRKKAGKAQPGRLLLLSPWLDLSMTDEAARAVEPKDIMLKIDPIRVMGQAWAGKRDPASPQCSPLFADIKDLPPTRIFQGRHDLFVVDCRNFMARAKEAGAPVTLYEYAGAPHVFMLVPYTREAKDVMALVREFLDE